MPAPGRSALTPPSSLTLARALGINARMAEPICDECGSSNIRRGHVFGMLVEECGLCGHLSGAADDVERVLEIREAEELGVAPELVGLLRTLESIPGVALDRRLSTAAGHSEPPAVYFALTRHPLELLDRFTRTLLLASRRTSAPWVIEATHQGRLLFVLRPRFVVPAAGAAAARAAMHDLGLLRDALRRDLKLAWWEIAE